MMHSPAKQVSFGNGRLSEGRGSVGEAHSRLSPEKLPDQGIKPNTI
ncbi:MAG: hypothetical protein ACI3V5_00505 [Faecousia sp.]